MISSYDWLRKTCFESEIVQIEGYVKDNPIIEEEENNYLNMKLIALKYMKKEVDLINEMVHYYYESR
jgi:hypothetical protein|tara:strand:- start:26 stop:226 length:201 start_codon:yes stop_codon:yes gene_type:complete